MRKAKAMLKGATEVKGSIRVGRCPYCDRKVRYGAGGEIDGNRVLYDWTCSCGTMGLEIYEQVFQTMMIGRGPKGATIPKGFAKARAATH